MLFAIIKWFKQYLINSETNMYIGLMIWNIAFNN